jgi:FkbM family methyltransferase
VRSRDGLILAIDPEAYPDAPFLNGGYYEREVLNAILANLDSDGVLWDVGANAGWHSVTTKYLRPDATVIAFEPVPFVAFRLMMNAELNDLDVSLLPIALAEQSGYQRLSVKVAGNSGLSSLNPWPGVKYDSDMSCRVEAGDCLIENGTAHSPTVIKLDIEGGELLALRGLTRCLSHKNLRAIIFESDSNRFAPISELLVARGFNITPLAPADPAVGNANFIAIPA